MSNDDIHKLITAEFNARTLGVTEQYLDIHEPVYENGLLKIERIDRDTTEIVIAYLPVKGEYFTFAVYIDPLKKEVFNIGLESRNTVTLCVTSEILSSKELISFTKLRPDELWDKGDLKPNKQTTYSSNYIGFTPNPEPDEYEHKLKKLLAFLYEDKEGICELVTNNHVNAYINVSMDFHYGNQLLGSALLDLKSIQQLNDLNLSIKFDFTAWGNPFK